MHHRPGARAGQRQQADRAGDGVVDVAAAELRRIGEADLEVDHHQRRRVADADVPGEALPAEDVGLVAHAGTPAVVVAVAVAIAAIAAWRDFISG